MTNMQHGLAGSAARYRFLCALMFTSLLAAVAPAVPDAGAGPADKTFAATSVDGALEVQGKAETNDEASETAAASYPDNNPEPVPGKPYLAALITIVEFGDVCPSDWAAANAVPDNPGLSPNHDTISASVDDTVTYCVNYVNAGDSPASLFEVYAGGNGGIEVSGVPGAEGKFQFDRIVSEPYEEDVVTVFGEYQSGGLTYPAPRTVPDEAGVVPPEPQPELDVLVTVVAKDPVSDPCPSTWAEAAAVVNNPGISPDPYDTIPAAYGDEVTFCVLGTNKGPGPAVNVVLKSDGFHDTQRYEFAACWGVQDCQLVWPSGAEFRYSYDSIATPESWYEPHHAVISGMTGSGPSDAIAAGSGIDEAGVTPVLPNLEVALTVVAEGEPCPSSWEAAAQVVPGPNTDPNSAYDTITAQYGDTVSYCLNATNAGDAPAYNVFAFAWWDGVPWPTSFPALPFNMWQPGYQHLYRYDHVVTEPNGVPPGTDPHKVGIYGYLDPNSLVEAPGHGNNDYAGVTLEQSPIGDVNCDGQITVTDVSNLLQAVVGLRDPVSSCPLANPASEVSTAAGDADDDGAITANDVALLMRCVVGAPDALC